MHTFSAPLTGLTVANLQNTYILYKIKFKKNTYTDKKSHYIKTCHGSISFNGPGTMFISAKLFTLSLSENVLNH